MDELVILDFETTGLSPNYSRVIEVGAVIISGTKVVDQLSQLMHPGCSIPYFITDITGITNQMISEMKNIGKRIDNKFLCTLKLARRLILDAPDYKLTTLTSHLKIKTPKEHKAHRALNDVMATLEIWLYIKKYVANYIKASPDFNFFEKLMKHPKNNILKLLDNYIAA